MALEPHVSRTRKRPATQVAHKHSHGHSHQAPQHIAVHSGEYMYSLAISTIRYSPLSLHSESTQPVRSVLLRWWAMGCIYNITTHHYRCSGHFAAWRANVVGFRPPCLNRVLRAMAKFHGYASLLVRCRACDDLIVGTSLAEKLVLCLIAKLDESMG